MKKEFVGNDFTATFTDEDGYFSLTGHTSGVSGAIGDRLAEIDPRFEFINTMHLSDCKTGAPMHAWENARYHIKKDNDIELQRHLRHLAEEYKTAYNAIYEAENLVKDISGYDARVVSPAIERLEAVKAEIKELWREDAKEVYNIINSIPSDLTEIDEDINLDSYEEPERVRALAQHLGCHFSLVEETTYNDNCFEAEGKEWLVVTDSEADQLWDDAMDNYLDECVLSELPSNVQNYFDTESWKEDAKMDGRGHSLNHWDGCEYYEEVDGETYYIYQQ